MQPTGQIEQVPLINVEPGWHYKHIWVSEERHWLQRSWLHLKQTPDSFGRRENGFLQVTHWKTF